MDGAWRFVSLRSLNGRSGWPRRYSRGHGEHAGALTGRGRTLALTLFGAAFFTVTMVIAQSVPALIYLLNSTAGLGWIIYLFMLPTVVTGIRAGFTASLGAYIGRRMTTTPPDALSERTRMSLGAGVGGAVAARCS